MKSKTSFDLRYVRSPKKLREIVELNISGKETSYYLFVSDWDDVSVNLLNRLEHKRVFCGDDAKYINVIDTWDIPNGLDIIRSMIQDFRESISVSPIRSYSQLPMLVVLHKAFPRSVEYNGSIWVELGA